MPYEDHGWWLAVNGPIQPLISAVLGHLEQIEGVNHAGVEGAPILHGLTAQARRCSAAAAVLLVSTSTSTFYCFCYQRMMISSNRVNSSCHMHGSCIGWNESMCSLQRGGAGGLAMQRPPGEGGAAQAAVRQSATPSKHSRRAPCPLKAPR